MVSRGSACLRRAAHGARGRIVRYDRFLGNAKVTTARIIEGWGATTAVAVRGREVLAIQDTCEVHIKTTAERRRGLGEIGKGNNHGLLLHAMVAVDTDTGHCLGLVDGDVRTRAGRRTTCHTERPLADKESRRWIDTARGGAAVLSDAARVTVIADAESDFYAGIVLIAREGLQVLCRSARDRSLAKKGSLYETVASWPLAAKGGLSLRAQPGRPARTADVEMRFGEVVLRRPAKTEPGLPESLCLRVVEVREPDPPAGIQPICWRLLTTHDVDSEDDAWRVVGMYRRRWVIEQFFRLLKSQGLNLEDTQVQTAERLLKLTAIAARAAIITLQLVQARDGQTSEPAAMVFDPDAEKVLEALAATRYAPRTKLQTKPPCQGNLGMAAWIIARLGGWDGYPKSKPPGPITMKRGLDTFQAILIGWKARDM